MNQVWKWIIGGVAHLLGGLRDMAAGIVGKVLAAFGLSIVTFQGILPSLKAFVMQFVSGLPAQVVQFLGAIGLGIAMSMILSALTVRMAWKIFIVPRTIADSLGGGA
jgi:hypothetical protein